MSTICDNHGISLIEVSLATFLIVIPILGLISLQPMGWKLTARSDYVGRAAGILHRELQATEAWLMNPAAKIDPNINSCPPPPGIPPVKTVLTSGQNTPQKGDAAFDVRTCVTDLGGNLYRVTASVTWAGNATGISESLIVTRQEEYRQ